MNQLFITLYLDEDMSILIAQLIQAKGFIAITTQAGQGKGASDEAQLLYATSRNQVLVTHNRVDFETLAQKYFAEGRDHAGLIIATRRSPYEIAKRLLLLLNHLTADEMRNQIRYI